MKSWIFLFINILRTLLLSLLVNLQTLFKLDVASDSLCNGGKIIECSFLWQEPTFSSILHNFVLSIHKIKMELCSEWHFQKGISWKLT